jgi:hypothetical protein
MSRIIAKNMLVYVIIIATVIADELKPILRKAFKRVSVIEIEDYYNRFAVLNRAYYLIVFEVEFIEIDYEKVVLYFSFETFVSSS